MLTGQLPIGHFDPPSRRKGVPKGLDEVVQRSLAQRPEERYQSAGDVSEDLRRHRVDAPVGGGKGSAASRANARATAPQEGRMPRSLKAVWLTAMLALLSLVLLRGCSWFVCRLAVSCRTRIGLR